MSDIVIQNMRDGYVELVHHVLNEGRIVKPRGYTTVEVQDMTFTVTDPLDCLPIGVGRKPKLAIGAAEALLMCGGIASPSLLTSVSGNFSRFLDGGDLHGGYGRRLGPQIARCAERLMQDRDTRQAVMTIWDPFYDAEDTRDLPCTIAMNFRIRAGKLNMGVVMRSNDVWLGTPYDVFMFTQLQLTMANIVGVDVGRYTHHAWSLHAYERNFESMETLHDFDPAEAVFDKQRANLSPGFGNASAPAGIGVRYEDDEPWDRDYARWTMQRARDIYDRQTLPSETRSEAWYRTVLEPFDRQSSIENFTS